MEQEPDQSRDQPPFPASLKAFPGIPTHHQVQNPAWGDCISVNMKKNLILEELAVPLCRDRNISGAGIILVREGEPEQGI